MHYPSSLPLRVVILRYLWLLCSSLVFLGRGTAQAQITPNGAGTVVNTQGNQINITGGTQAGANLFHSFGDFNVNSAQVANFLSNPQTQNILSRINGGNPSFINGLLQVTGGNSNLFLMNPAGIVFGQGASLNVPASFTATTANQIGLGNNQYFAATGNNNYAALTGNPDSFLFTTTQAGSIVNAGDLAVGSGQNISLIAGNTINTDRLSAPGGEIQVLAVPGTNRVRLSQPGQVLSLEIVLPDSNELKAVDLPTLLTGSDLPGIVVNPSGQIEVAGTSLPSQQGIAVASGRIDVSSSVGNGGTVQVMGDRVAALNSRINANGATGGGTVRLGGEYLGGRDTGIAPELRFNSQRTLVDRDSLIRANATLTGEGGRVIVWADQNTGYFGRITGRGATGRGGFVEVSGKKNLAFDGRVELQGFNGLNGSLLLDPASIVIQAAAGTGDGLLPTILAATLPDPMTISAGALANIAAGTAINITASNSIDFQADVILILNGTAPITFTAPTILASAGVVTLSSQGRNVVLSASTINAPNLNIATVGNGNSGSIQATASTGNLTLGNVSSGSFGIDSGGTITLNAPQGNITAINIDSNANNSGNGGAINITAQGNIITSANIFSYSQVNGNGGAVNLTAQGNITTSGNIHSFAVNGNGGAVNLTAQGNITTSGAIYSDSSGNGNGGAINVNATQGFFVNGSIEAGGRGAGNTGGAIDITAGNLIRVGLNPFSCANTSVCSSGRTGAANGAITIRHGGGTTTPFIVGDSTTNGTTGAIDAGAGNIINPIFSVPVPPSTYTQGIVNIITAAPPVIPPVTPAASPTFPPELLALLRNPPAPVTPTPVVVGAPPDPPLVESPISLIIPPVVPIVVPPVIPTPPPSPVVISTPISIPIPIASPNLPSELRTTLANLTPQDSLPRQDSPSGTLTLITNPSDEAISAILSDVLPFSSVSENRNNLNQNSQATGIKSGLIYIFFTPKNQGTRNEDTLEIILITGRGEPRRVQISGINRSQVLGVVDSLRTANSNRAVNLSAARQIYQWILDPIESELQQQEIDNLIFVLDPELRSLPLESLYDGQGFIRERYTLSVFE
jgi:filamentous hemagglutinin family protein